MNAPETGSFDHFISDIVMPKLLECGSELHHWDDPLPIWWIRFMDGDHDEKRVCAKQIINDQSRKLQGVELKLDLLAAISDTDLVDLENIYREISLIPLSEIGHLTQCAQNVVIGARHVIEDLDDGFSFGVEDKALEGEILLLKQQSKRRYCR